MLAALTNNEWVLVVAIIIFILGGALCFAKDVTLNVLSRFLLYLGLAVFALAFIVNP